jgi:hypothetical protein
MGHRQIPSHELLAVVRCCLHLNLNLLPLPPLFKYHVPCCTCCTVLVYLLIAAGDRAKALEPEKLELPNPSEATFQLVLLGLATAKCYVNVSPFVLLLLVVHAPCGICLMAFKFMMNLFAVFRYYNYFPNLKIPLALRVAPSLRRPASCWPAWFHLKT